MNEFSSMIGRTMNYVSGDPGDEEMVFKATDGSVFRFYHERDCCENVSIDDICGDMIVSNAACTQRVLDIL